MHCSFFILEILSTILSSCDHPTLSTIARTCNLFHDPALDLLWRHQDSFVNLLKTMPSDLWVQKEDGLVRDVMLNYLFLISLISSSSTFEGRSFLLTSTCFTSMRGESNLFRIMSLTLVRILQTPCAHTNYRYHCCQTSVNLRSSVATANPNRAYA
jgi:hypothetical protein